MPRQPMTKFISDILEAQPGLESFAEVWPKICHINGGTKERVLYFCANKAQSLKRCMESGVDMSLETLTKMLNYNSLAICLAQQVNEQQKEALLFALTYPKNDETMKPKDLLQKATYAVRLSVQNKCMTDKEERALYLRAYRKMAKSEKPHDRRTSAYLKKAYVS